MFETLLAVAYDNGGSLLKFGGDALLMWFDGDGHAARACRAAALMRAVLGEVGSIELPDAQITLRMAQGVHSGTFHFFAVGDSHLELFGDRARVEPARRDASTGASADEIVASPETGALLAPECLGDAKEPGRLLLREPPGEFAKMPLQSATADWRRKRSRAACPAVRVHLPRRRARLPSIGSSPSRSSATTASTR